MLIGTLLPPSNLASKWMLISTGMIRSRPANPEEDQQTAVPVKFFWRCELKKIEGIFGSETSVERPSCATGRCRRQFKEGSETGKRVICVQWADELDAVHCSAARSVGHTEASISEKSVRLSQVRIRDALHPGCHDQRCSKSSPFRPQHPRQSNCRTFCCLSNSTLGP